MSEQFSTNIVYQWLDTIIASLDCYTWVFSQGFLNPCLFQGKFSSSINSKIIYFILSDNNQQSRLIPSLSYFITKISMNTLYDIVTYFPPSNQTHVFTPTDINQFET
jgi:hypothetical protein